MRKKGISAMSMKPRVEDTGNVDSYVREGERKAYELGNRGPIRFNADGTPRPGDFRRLLALRFLRI